jgi:uncharacterized membrane protein YgdD (TMEM256/DUF423 family)
MTRAQRLNLAAGALLAGLGVTAGAFGAHGLRAILNEAALGWWETAVRYQMWHALALMILAVLPLRRIGWSALLMGAGTLIFSGTLYAMALTDLRWLGAVTPLGGLLMIAGWAALAYAALVEKRDRGVDDEHEQRQRRQ